MIEAKDPRLTSAAILEAKVIQDKLRTTPELDEKIKKAAAAVKEKSGAIEGVLKAIPCLENNKIKVFFSYKKPDEPTAVSVVKELRNYAGGKLDITYMAEFTEKISGEEWNNAIRDGIRQANWFILLLPDPTSDWDWCLFETGMFRGRMVPGDRLFCLHHPSIKDLPPQIHEFQAVKAEQQDMEGFLKKVYLQDNPVPGLEPVNVDLADIPNIASRLIDYIKPPAHRHRTEFYNRYIVIAAEGASQVESPDDLASIPILESNKSTMAIFGRQYTPKTFGELLDDMPTDRYSRRWVEELADCIGKAANGKTFEPVHATLKGQDVGRRFRPILHSADVEQELGGAGSSGKALSFHISLMEEVSSISQEYVEPKLAAVASNLRFAYRFRSEILDRFKNGLKSDQHAKEFGNILHRIESDAESRGITDPELLYKALSENEESEIRKISDYWYEIRKPEGGGKLDMAIKNEDYEEISDILKKVEPLNRLFMEILLTKFMAYMKNVD